MKLASIVHNLPTGISNKHGIKGFVFDKGERVLMGAALGYAKGYYYDKLVFKGIGIEAIVGVVGSLAAAIFPHGALSRHLEIAGDAGLTAYAYSMGASYGADHAGRGVVSTKTLPTGKKAVVGMIPPRRGGAFLTADEMANISAPR